MSTTIKKHVDHWINSSNESLKDMEALLKSDRRMNAMYTGHLAVEKMFKAILAAQDVKIIWQHKLVPLAEKCGFGLTSDLRAELLLITEFNTAAKYASVKSMIHQRCTPQYVKQSAILIRKWHKYLKLEVMRLRAALPDRTPATHPEDMF